MSYEEWAATLFPFEAKTLTRKEIFQAGAASRDAEIAELVAALEHSVLYVPDLATVPGIAAALAKVRKP